MWLYIITFGFQTAWVAFNTFVSSRFEDSRAKTTRSLVDLRACNSRHRKW